MYQITKSCIKRLNNGNEILKFTLEQATKVQRGVYN
jgi:hypothetical protein